MTGALTLAWVERSADHAERNMTGLRPRARADSVVLVSALAPLMEFGPATDDSPTTPDGPL